MMVRETLPHRTPFKHVPICPLALLDLRQVLQSSSKAPVGFNAPGDFFSLIPCGASLKGEQWGQRLLAFLINAIYREAK
jgi:hypothetical protein